jgi:hypothetical protein
VAFVSQVSLEIESVFDLPGQDDRSGHQGSTLGQEGNDLADRKDEIAEAERTAINNDNRLVMLEQTHSSPLCCTVCPLRLLWMVIFPISSIWDAWTNAGPIGQARSKDFE